jgi:putative phage-type endonuclease
MLDRRTGIGGSDIAGIIGAVPPGHPHYKTAYEVYEEKVSGISKDLSNNEAVKWGNIFENPIAKIYEEETGKQLCCSSTFRHKEYPFLMANPDRLIIGERKGVEIKTTGYLMRNFWGESGSKDVPESYYLQVAHYMLVLDYEEWDLCVLIGGQDFRTYTFKRDAWFDELIIHKAATFWKENVEKKVPPIIDYSDKNVQNIIRKKYNHISTERVELDYKYIEVANKFEEANKNIKNYNKILNESKSEILDAMGFAGVAVLPDGRTFKRTLVQRKGYSVDDTQYIKFKFEGGINDSD